MRRSLPLVAVVLAGCFQSVSAGFNDGGPPPPPEDRLTLSARVCTTAPDPTGFPVKVVLILDQSGSMCVSDAPGSQQVSGFCENAAAFLAPNLPTEPARVKAVKRLLNDFHARTDVSLALVPFSTHVQGHWPPNGGFAPMSDPTNYASALQRVNSLQSELGKGSDFQGALAFARQIVANDIVVTEVSDRDQLPRTRYVVLLVTDGTPFPRCSVNDNLGSGFANSLDPDKQWPDSPGASTYCNTIDPIDPEAIPGLVAGGDRNQNAQLFAEVDQLIQLKAARRVGEIRFHTLLLFNAEATAQCGPLCQDLHGTYPEVPPAQYPTAARSVAHWLLGKLAERGNGTYSEAVDSAGLANLVFPQDYGSLVSKNHFKSFIVRPMTSVPGLVDRELDSDGDGLPDALETATNPLQRDTDGDCFDDGFEVARAAAGFDPLVKDGRGCDPQSPATPGCLCRDTDGDGLSQFAESYLATFPTRMDTDGDGVHDGLEARWGLNPLVATGALFDSDSDTVPDLEEIRGGSDPLVADSAFRAAHTFRYSVTTSPGPYVDTTCYDFTVENLQRLEGHNLYRIDVAEAPTSISAIDFGTWRSACTWAQYAPGVGRGTGSVADMDFRAPSQLLTPADYVSRCAGTPP